MSFNLRRKQGRAIRNSNPLYTEKLRDRGLKSITQWETENISPITFSDYNKIQTKDHIWRFGDRFYKLADETYDNPGLWWILAWFNGKPTESHVEVGEIIKIPLDIDVMTEIWERRASISSR